MAETGLPSAVELVRRALLLAAGAVEGWSAICTLYLLGLLAAARAAPVQRTTATAPAGEPLRFACLVPAHDEAGRVAAAVEALVAQDHPAGRHEVIVIADNCTDRTAAEAAAAGATVWARDAPDDRGKGQALAWALERLWVERPDVDAVAMVDADCIASPGLLSAFDCALRSGAAAVQAGYVVSNPDESTSSALRWAGFALMHDIRPRGKERLGVSAGLFGTGMAFSAGLLREHPWSSFSITEDAEYHARLVQAGERVRSVPGAWVASRMPTTDAEARAQQMRWETGNSSLLRETALRLLLDGARRGDRVRAHAGFEQLVPPQTLLLSALVASGGLGAVLRSRALGMVAALGILGQAVYVIGGLRVAEAPPSVMRALRRGPLLALRKLSVFGRIAVGRGATGWVRTERGDPPT